MPELDLDAQAVGTDLDLWAALTPGSPGLEALLQLADE